MSFQAKRFFNLCSFFSITTLVLLSNVAISQAVIKGRVIYKKDASPAAAANVELLHDRGRTFANQEGAFSLALKNIRADDTLMISSVGYEKLKIPLSAAILKREFALTELVKNMEGVTVYNTAVLGSTAESVGYFRSWNTKKSGGEIGRIFKLPYKKYKIDKVRFKVANFCDTCLLRVHIREVVDGLPGREILKDSISTFINKHMLEGKVPEFDLSAYDLNFTQDELYVSLEVLNCSVNPKEVCSFSFAGTEKGVYIFKPNQTAEWQVTDDYTVYLKLFLRY